MRTLGGRYQLEQRIGMGGMSEVWRAHDHGAGPDGRGEADPRPTRTTRPTSVERIRAEARSAARLVHPNVASVHDFGTSTTGRAGRCPTS